MNHNTQNSKPNILTFRSDRTYSGTRSTGRNTALVQTHVSKRHSEGSVHRTKHILKDINIWEQGSGWGFFIAGVGLLLAVVLGGVFYITQVTGSAMEGYDVTLLEQKVEELKGTQRQLELEAAELQSLRHVQDKVEKLNMIPPTNIAYTTPIISGTTAMSLSRGE